MRRGHGAGQPAGWGVISTGAMRRVRWRISIGAAGERPRRSAEVGGSSFAARGFGSRVVVARAAGSCMRIEVVGEAGGADERERRDHREAEVVRDFGRGTGHAADHRDDQVAEVVVGDGVAGEPGILRREVRGARRGVDVHEVHRLLRAADRSDLHAQPDGDEEDDEEQRLDAEDVAPVVLEPGDEFVTAPVGERTGDDARARAART